MPTASACPARPDRDDRKSASIAAAHHVLEPGVRLADRFGLVRDVLRSATMWQATLSGNQFSSAAPEQAPVLFLDGEPHRRKRTEIARFFTPVAVTTRYQTVMEREAEALLGRLRRDGRGVLDEISFELAVAVVGEVVGLTETPTAAMARRIEATFTLSGVETSPFRRKASQLRQALRVFWLFLRDVRPAIAARRRAPREDVISHLIERKYGSLAILIECMTYAFAGMVTTREFIVMAAWHLFDRDDLRARFVAGREAEQTAILDEILRLEPVASTLYRRAVEPTSLDGVELPAESRVQVDIRAANLDASVVGACPFAIDPDRAAQVKGGATHLSFGDGRHRCPGAQLAMHESRVFLDRLFRVPGLRLAQAPTMSWNTDLASYELRGAVVTCDREPGR